MAEIAGLKTRLTEVAGFKMSDLVSRTEWGAMNFSSAARDLDSIYEIVSFLNDLPIARLPQDAVNQLDTSLQGVLNWLTRINKFSLDQGSPAQARDEIVANIANAQQDLYRHAHVWIPFLAYLRGDIPNHLKAISGSVTVASSQAEDFSKYLAAQKVEIESIISATREASPPNPTMRCPLNRVNSNPTRTSTIAP